LVASPAVGILKMHVHVHREVFALPDMFAEPVLQIGYQIIVGNNLPEDYDYPDVKAWLAARGVTDVTAIDYFDHKADLRYDLNRPVPEHEHERYRTVIDIGTIEHLFDTRQCLENCMRMTAVGGQYFLHTPVKGYFEHGLHTFHPLVLTRALEINGFEIVWQRYTSARGEPLESADDAEDALLWVVARKLASMGEFQIPQQDEWGEAYAAERKAALGGQLGA
jgi:hypothetical protein